jgi:hypothetical protein
MERQLGEQQMGFRPGRGCSDALFTMAQLTSWSREFKKPLSVCFVDLTKAYDSVSCPTPWLILRQQGVPEKIVDLLEDLHTGSKATIKAFGGESRPFEIKGGVRQGCNIAPLLFNIFLDFVTKQAASQFASNGRTAGVSFRFSFEGKPFFVPAEGVGELELLAILMYADDMALVAEDDEQLNHQIQVLAAVTKRWGLTINVRKTKIWRGAWLPEPETPPPEIAIRGETLEEVEDFKYLGSTLADTGGLEKELDRRKALAIGRFARLKWVWENNLITVPTKMKFYRAFITSTLLYGCESWATTQEQERQLNVVHMRFLRKIVGVTLRDKQRNDKVANRCNIPQVPALLSMARMRWAGHLIRMGGDRLPKKTFFGALADEGRRGKGRPRQRLVETYNKDFKEMAKAYQERFKVDLNHLEVDETFFVNGPDLNGRRITRSAATKVRVSWWTLAVEKFKWRACLDFAFWTRKPSALTGSPVRSAH